MTAADLPYSWRKGCPVGPSRLRRIQLSFWGFDDHAHTGTLVVRDRSTAAIIDAFRSLYAARFPIRRMVPVDAYKGSDPDSMEADNTSAFNCRNVAGTDHWSEHAYGEAIDVNPVENPYVQGDHVSPRNGQPYADRSPYRKGMAVEGGTLVGAFAAEGWLWGGHWSNSKDYQHFSPSGR